FQYAQPAGAVGNEPDPESDLVRPALLHRHRRGGYAATIALDLSGGDRRDHGGIPVHGAGVEGVSLGVPGLPPGLRGGGCQLLHAFGAAHFADCFLPDDVAPGLVGAAFSGWEPRSDPDRDHAGSLARRLCRSGGGGRLHSVARETPRAGDRARGAGAGTAVRVFAVLPLAALAGPEL